MAGNGRTKATELIEELKLVENGRRIAEEAVALHHAEQCPEGKFDIILIVPAGVADSRIDRTSIELDRVLGMKRTSRVRHF